MFKHIPFLVCTLAMNLFYLPFLQAQNTSELRLLSLMIRDQNPVAEEINQFVAKEKSLEQFRADWLASEAHTQRVQRYFRDMFGVRKSIQAIDGYLVLNKNEDGIYRLNAKDDCSVTTAMDIKPWFAEGEETIRVCGNSFSSAIAFGEDDEFTNCLSSWWRMSQVLCGCGPELIGCITQELEDDLRHSMRNEFAIRASYAYRQNLSWLEMFAGDFFYGNRLLYWKYLMSQKMQVSGEMPSTTELNDLKSLPLLESDRRNLPSGAERAGLVTMPGFLNQFNDFRTRIRALSEGLLCQPISPTLNTSNLTEFLNEDLTEEDLAHANQPDCAGCHFPLDNMGAMLFGWSPTGEYNHFEGRTSQKGHVFGETGNGPKLLMNRFITHGPGFQDCMVSKAWSDFTGQSYFELPKEFKTSLSASAEKGPFELISTILNSNHVFGPNFDPNTQNVEVAEEPAVPVVPFSEISPIIERSCSGSSCHSSGSVWSNYVGNEQLLKQNAISVSKRISASGSGVMPPKGAGRDLTFKEIESINNFLQVQ